MKTKIFAWFLLLTTTACATIEDAIPRYHEFIVRNDCSNRIIIKSFEKGKIIDTIPIVSKGSFVKDVEERIFNNNPSIFGTRSIDSVIVFNESANPIILYCHGQSLEPTNIILSECPQLKNSLIDMRFNGEEEVRKFVHGKKILYRYSLTYTDTDFN